MTSRNHPNSPDSLRAAAPLGAWTCRAAGAAASLPMLLALAATPSLVLGGCGKKQEVVQEEPPPPPPPPPPPAPRITPVATLMASLNIDPRVRLPEELAPDNDAARIAVLQFFDAFVRGDAASLADMLSDPDRNELEILQRDGTWERATAKVSRVDVRAGQADDGMGRSQPVVLALFYTGAEFQPQLWAYQTTPAASFSAEPTPPNVENQLSGEDWIAAWYEILAAERLKADEPDEKIVIKSVNKDDQSELASDTQHTGRPIRGGGGVPGRRPPTEPIDPPGLTPGGN